MIILFFFLLLGSCTSKETYSTPEEPVRKYHNLKKLLEDTEHRPDLRVLYLEHHTNILKNNIPAQIDLMEGLLEIGKFQESIDLGKKISKHKMHFFRQGKVYFIQGKNYLGLNDVEKARTYFDKTLRMNNQYYLFYYARMEEFESNFTKSITLYEKALNHGLGKKKYIRHGYTRALNKAILFYKNKDQELYNKYLQTAKTNKYQNARARVIEKSIKI
ncbi:MAG: tetratricopeptide repeat protein [Brevinemataceae bacterium]